MRKPFIYEKISGQIRTLIDQGVIKPGDKLESVRALSVTKNVSLSTAFKAYEELVIKDVIESRPKSG
ncbi:MAG: GntR family transcriptional regulator, partial [Reichenbachiella sp.]